MNREDILHMARESGMYRILDEHANEFGSGMADINLCGQYPELEDFAKLVAAAEREACAKITDGQLFNTNALLVYPMQSSAAYEIGCAIRARSNT